MLQVIWAPYVLMSGQWLRIKFQEGRFLLSTFLFLRCKPIIWTLNIISIVWGTFWGILILFIILLHRILIHVWICGLWLEHKNYKCSTDARRKKWPQLKRCRTDKTNYKLFHKSPWQNLLSTSIQRAQRTILDLKLCLMYFNSMLSGRKWMNEILIPVRGFISELCSRIFHT